MTQPTLARATLLFVGVVLGSACADAPVAAPLDAAAPMTPVSSRAAFSRAQGATDRVIVELNGAESPTFAREVERLGGRIERRHADAGFVVTAGLSSTAIASLAKRADVASVTHDARVQWIPAAASTQHRQAARRSTVIGPDQSSACFFNDFQWNMRVTQASDAWTRTPAGNGVSVYVLDSGVDPEHLDLSGRVDLARSRSFAEREPGDIRDHNSHGSFVSAIIASNGVCVASVAPLATIVGVKVIDASGFGAFSDVISGVIYAADQGAEVINLSLGSMADLDVPEWRDLVRYFQSAVRYAEKKGAVVVAASGNGDANFMGIDLSREPRNMLFVPAELKGVVSVGATGPVGQVNFDRLASYSNFGFKSEGDGGVDLFAPGGDYVGGSIILDLIIGPCSEYTFDGAGQPTVCPGNDFYYVDIGTSFASPMVAGAAAVTRSMIAGPRSAREKIVECLLHSADEIGPRSVFGYGRLNVLSSAACAAGRDRKSIAN